MQLIRITLPLSSRTRSEIQHWGGDGALKVIWMLILKNEKIPKSYFIKNNIIIPKKILELKPLFVIEFHREQVSCNIGHGVLPAAGDILRGE